MQRMQYSVAFSLRRTDWLRSWRWNGCWIECGSFEDRIPIQRIGGNLIKLMLQINCTLWPCFANTRLIMQIYQMIGQMHQQHQRSKWNVRSSLLYPRDPQLRALMMLCWQFVWNCGSQFIYLTCSIGKNCLMIRNSTLPYNYAQLWAGVPFCPCIFYVGPVSIHSMFNSQFLTVTSRIVASSSSLSP